MNARTTPSSRISPARGLIRWVKAISIPTPPKAIKQAEAAAEQGQHQVFRQEEPAEPAGAGA